MKSGVFPLLLASILFLFFPLAASVKVGVGRTDIIPPIGTPSAGYMVVGRNMQGIHDPLLATALVIESEGQRIALCSVDHLGFDYGMVREVQACFPDIKVLIGASHTHSGAGSYLNIPIISEMLAGPYNPAIRQMLIDQTVKAIQEAIANLQEANIGIGYGHAPSVNMFRSNWPEDGVAPDDVAVIKFTSKSGQLLALLFNYAVHPTVLSAKNTLYSADCVGSARRKIEETVGGKALYFNGAQADIGPNLHLGLNEYEQCEVLGEKLAQAVVDIANQITPSAHSSIFCVHYPYRFEVQPTTADIRLPLDFYDSELNILIFNHTDVFITIPGELSCVYGKLLKEKSPFPHTSFFGLTNDAHGYIILPEAFDHKTKESALCFGGRHYGEWMVRQLLLMLHQAPQHE